MKRLKLNVGKIWSRTLQVEISELTPVEKLQEFIHRDKSLLKFTEDDGTGKKSKSKSA